MNHGHNMDPDFEKLLQLLKKILRKHPQTAEQIAKLGSNKGFNLNICFLTFLPMTPDELEELSEMYEEQLRKTEESHAATGDADMEFRLTNEDMDFLKKNGLEF
jgi:hypothetical protein